MSDIAEAYDSVPYENCVYDYTAPQYLNAMGRLYGMNPPDWRRADLTVLADRGDPGTILKDLAAKGFLVG